MSRAKTSAEVGAQGREQPPIRTLTATQKGAWSPTRVKRFIAPTLVALFASILLLWGLADSYLWQDEANTAVLAARFLRFGRPLAYDGVNLVSIDSDAEDAGTIDQRTGSAAAAIAYCVRRHEFRPDTAWTAHPWGQFIVAAVSLRILGHNTFAARLPFAIASILTVLLLYRFVNGLFGNNWLAFLASALLVLNAYWILHGRQCRYYSLSSLFLLLTLMAYARWQGGGRWGVIAFLLAAWCWFQVDYGTLWPVLGVLFVDAFLAARRRKPWQPALVGAALAAMIVPFILYYEPWGRLAAKYLSRELIFKLTLFHVNEYVVPIPIVLAAATLVAWRWKGLPALERRLVVVACMIIAALLVWVPLVAQSAYLRYVIVAAPVGCLLSAWVLVRGLNLRPVYAGLGALVLILTPWLSIPLHLIDPPPYWYTTNLLFRSELSMVGRRIFSPPPDPNRIVIDWLRQNAAPTDEILINYEDLPLIFYLPNPIRGGMAAFRVADDSRTPPAFLLIRRSFGVPFWAVFQREIARYHWIDTHSGAPDVPWGNNPDPVALVKDFSKAGKMLVARRATSAERGSPIGEGLQALQDRVNELRDLATQNPGQYAPALATALDNLGSVDHQQNRLAEAQQNYDDSLKIRRQLAEKDPARYLPSMAMTLNDLGIVESLEKRLKEARQHDEEALAIERQLAEQSPALYLPYISLTLSNLGNLDRQQNRTDDARLHFQASLRIYRQLAQEGSSNPTFWNFEDTFLPGMATTLNNLGDLYFHQNRMDEARQCYAEASNVYGRLAQHDPGKYLPSVAGTLNYLGFLNRKQNRIEESRADYEEALTLFRQLAQGDSKYAGDVAATEASLKELGKKAPSR